MRIRILSDLHLEFQQWNPPKADADVVVLAGDIDVGIHGVEWARRSGIAQMINAALAGFDLAYVPEDLVRPHLAKLRLQRVLEDWCQPYSGYHLYYPSRRQPSAAFALMIDALRHRP